MPIVPLLAVNPKLLAAGSNGNAWLYSFAPNRLCVMGSERQRQGHAAAGHRVGQAGPGGAEAGQWFEHFVGATRSRGAFDLTTGLPAGSYRLVARALWNARAEASFGVDAHAPAAPLLLGLGH